MSESLIHYDVASQISAIAALADTNCEGFAHRIYNQRTAFTAATEADIITILVPANSALIIVGIEVKTLYDTSDAALVGGDFRSTFDLNPYGPYIGAGAVGQFRIFIAGQQYCATMFDFALLGAGILLVVDSEKTFVLKANPNQPVGKNLTLVTRAQSYTVPQAAASELKKKETQFLVG